MNNCFPFPWQYSGEKKYSQISSLIRENQVIFTSRPYVIPKHRCDLEFRLKMTASAYHLKILKFFNAGPVISSKWKIQLDILLINVYSHVAVFFQTSLFHYLRVQRQKWKHLKNVWNLFKVNSKDARTTSWRHYGLNRFHTTNIEYWILNITTSKVYLNFSAQTNICCKLFTVFINQTCILNSCK